MAPTRHGTATLYGIAVALLVAPCFVFQTIPLYDLPDHIARQHILFDPAGIGFDRYYAVHWRPIPNLAMEGWVFLLHRLVSIETAVRLFLAATVAQLFLCTLALNRALSARGNPLPLAAALFVYSGPFLAGFVNFCFGLGWALWVFALWLRWRDRAWSIPLFALLASVALFAHLFAFGVYALIVVGCWGGAAAPRRDPAGEPSNRPRLRGIAHLVVPMAIYAVAMPHEGGLVWSYGPVWTEKLQALGSLLGYSVPIADWVLLSLTMVGAIVLAPRLTIARQMHWPLAGLAIAFALLPHRLGDGSFVDYRMPLCAVLLLIGSLLWRDPADRWRPAATACVAILLAARLGLVYAEWASWQPDYAEYRSAFAALPEGARLLPLTADPGTVNLYDHPPLDHIAALAVTERGALIPTLFADNEHQLLSYRPRFGALAARQPGAEVWAAYDYILLVWPERFAGRPLPRYEPIARGRTFVLGRLTRG